MTRVALVTGGGTGIGAAIARRLAADGYDVAVTGRRQGPIDEVAEELGGLAIVADTGGEADAERAVAESGGPLRRPRRARPQCRDRRRGLARRPRRRHASRSVLRTNVTGAFLMARAAISHLYERHGAIVSIASVAGAAGVRRRASRTARRRRRSRC